MRITEQLKARQTLNHVNKLTQRQSEAAEQALTGQRVSRPSQDTAAWSGAQRLQRGAERMAAYQEVGHQLETTLQMTDDALGELANVLTRARELSMQFSSKLHDQELLDNAALDVRALRESVREVANTEIGGRFLFGGVREDSPPMDSAFTYQGSAQRRTVEVAPGTTIDQPDGAGLFGGPQGAAAIVDRLALALEQGRVEDARLIQDEIDDALDRTAAARYRAGSQIETIRQARSLSELLKQGAQQEAGRLTEADFPAAISDFENTRQALSAVAELSSRARQMDLFLKL